jgi:DNA helicase-2/ATP-dependent DNA helicase PcrA
MTRTGSGRNREQSRFLAEMRARGTVVAAATPSGVVRQGRSTGSRERRRKPPGRCRVCGAGLVTAPERTLGRCSTCPGHPDELLAERLRVWRSATAKERGVPAYVVFTDMTLAALAERKPRDEAELLDIPGIGPAKYELYGEVLLAMVADSRGGVVVTDPGLADPDLAEPDLAEPGVVDVRG